MMKIYTVPAGPSLFESGCLPTMVYLSQAELDAEGRARAAHSHHALTELLLVLDGRGLHRIGEQEYRSVPGDLLIYNADMVHDERACCGTTVHTYCCGISHLYLKGLPPDQLTPPDSPYLLKSGRYFPALRAMFEMGEQYLIQGGKHAGELTQGVLTSMIVLVRELAAQAEPDALPEKDGHSALITAMRSYIDQNFASDFSLDAFAAHFGISRFYASHIFQRETGYSPTQYRLRRRIGEAQSLLTDTDYSITYIAGLVGYDNPNHFSQIFSKMVGMAPKQFRSLSVQPKYPPG